MAIKVSGTEVISNARALTNIASVDATTVASLATAGVGGSITDLGRTTFSGSMSYYDVTLPSGYNHHRLVIDSPVGSVVWYPLKTRFLGASSNLLTSNLYSFNRVHNQFTRSQDNYMEFTEVGFGANSPTNGDFWRLQMDIYYANDSTQFTKIHTFGFARSIEYNGAVYIGVNSSAFYQSNIVTPALRFYCDTGSLYSYASNYVQKYGIK